MASEDSVTKANILVYDGDYTNNSIKLTAIKLEKILLEYTKTLEKLSSASEGKLAENIKKLKDLVTDKLAGILEESNIIFSAQMKEYQSKIDDADDKLY